MLLQRDDSETEISGVLGYGYFVQLNENFDDYKILFYKLALTSADRASENSQLTVKVSDSGSCILFKLSKPTKNWKLRNHIHSIVFNEFKKKSLCVV